jgi:ABC-type nitrate/sulfonate/bicarbonate transport system substrate-binding protein
VEAKLGIRLVLSAGVFAAALLHAAETLSMVNVGRGSSLQWPLYIGMAKGLFKQKGIELDMIAAPSSAGVQQQLASGSVPLGSGGLVDPIRAIDIEGPADVARFMHPELSRLAVQVK